MGVFRWLRSFFRGDEPGQVTLSEIKAGGSRYRLMFVERGNGALVMKYYSLHLPIPWGELIEFELGSEAQAVLREALRQ